MWPKEPEELIMTTAGLIPDGWYVDYFISAEDILEDTKFLNLTGEDGEDENNFSNLSSFAINWMRQHV
jgi:hypothetical protein